MKTISIEQIEGLQLNVHHQKKERAVYFDDDHYYKIWVKNWEHSKVANHGFSSGYYDSAIAGVFKHFIVDTDGSHLGYAMKKGKVAGGSRDSWQKLINLTSDEQRKEFIKTVFSRAKKHRCIVSDMCPANVVVFKDSISLIDYEGLASFDWFFQKKPQFWEAQSRNLKKYPTPFWRDMSKYLIEYCRQCLGIDFSGNLDSEIEFLKLHDAVMKKVC